MAPVASIAVITVASIAVASTAVASTVALIAPEAMLHHENVFPSAFPCVPASLREMCSA